MGQRIESQGGDRHLATKLHSHKLAGPSMKQFLWAHDRCRSARSSSAGMCIHMGCCTGGWARGTADLWDGSPWGFAQSRSPDRSWRPESRKTPDGLLRPTRPPA